MKINSVKISNILSFGFKTDFDSAPVDISFDEKINILIGANGSGKSNFAEVIFTLFQSYFLEPYKYDFEFYTDRAKHQEYLVRNNDSGQSLRLNKHIDYKSNESHLEIKFKVSDSDRNNIKFIKNNLSELDEIAKEFFHSLALPSSRPFAVADIDSIKTVSFKFLVNNTSDANKVTFTHLLQKSENVNQQILDSYLKDFDLYKKIIEIGRDKQAKDWNPFSVSFEFLGAHRQVNSFPTNIDFSAGQGNRLGDLLINKKSQNIKNNTDTSSIFGVATAKIGREIRKDVHYSSMNIDDAIKKQFSSEGSLIFNLNVLLKNYLGLSIRSKGGSFDYQDILHTEIYECSTENTIDFQQLSSGQKSIFTLIFLAIGSELQEGLLVIDEPEIHLHPKFQRKYFSLLKDFSEKYSLQSILITHSPVFVDEKTIKSTYRFYINNRITKVIKGDSVTEEEEQLVKFLSYTNSSKIFFTKKVILVEGDSDSYFYTYLVNNHIKTDEDVEFLPIGSKSMHKKWSEFLDKFKIEHYFVTDFDFIDNAKDLGISDKRKDLASVGLDTEEIKRLRSIEPFVSKEIKEKSDRVFDSLLGMNLDDVSTENLDFLKKGVLLRREKAVKFADIIMELDKDIEYSTKINETIKRLRQKNIYVLRFGDLEEYLNIHNKGLRSVIRYCADNKYPLMGENFRLDLEGIFNDILSK